MEECECVLCHRTKPIPEFYVHSSRGRSKRCLECVRDWWKQYYQKNKKKWKQYYQKNKKKWKQRYEDAKKNDPEAVRAKNHSTYTRCRSHLLEKRYGITVEQYEQMDREQGGLCKICRRPPGKKRLHVDHDHKTGDVRGLLCSNCNRVLGLMEDREDWLRAAVRYLGEERQQSSAHEHGMPRHPSA